MIDTNGSALIACRVMRRNAHSFNSPSAIRCEHNTHTYAYLCTCVNFSTLLAPVPAVQKNLENTIFSTSEIEFSSP